MIKPAIAITIGDPAGIGPEIVKKATSDKSVLKICRPIVIGTSINFVQGFPTRKSDKAAVSFLIRALKLVNPVRNPALRDAISNKVKNKGYKPCVISARSEMKTKFHFTHSLDNKKVDAIVTAPVSKSAFTPFGVAGHTEFLAKKTDSKNVEMLMVSVDKKVLLLTRHIPLKDVSKNISKEKIVKSVIFVAEFIKEKFKIKVPRIVVCGLNPHCGDNGLIGAEEKKKIIPAIKSLIKRGLDVAGPVNPETAFLDTKSDLIVCMYHDQAMLPLKLLNPDKIVNVTVGLPFIRTSPGHGTAYNIAGKNKANPQPMIEAIKLACHLTKNN
ncbi:MAG: 4-hydroxythreonine-4-phosphate dehydrogenase PdxA [Elusimicrobia bacterium]|nr:4-hydroxythreonine-4-phosphate dehydrogenase PdxA [Elusimicrobiota bacterium]